MNTPNKQKFYRHSLTYIVVLIFLGIINIIKSPIIYGFFGLLPAGGLD